MPCDHSDQNFHVKFWNSQRARAGWGKSELTGLYNPVPAFVGRAAEPDQDSCGAQVWFDPVRIPFVAVSPGRFSCGDEKSSADRQHRQLRRTADLFAGFSADGLVCPLTFIRPAADRRSARPAVIPVSLTVLTVLTMPS